MLIFLLKNRPNQVFSTFPENPDLAYVQSAIKHGKMVENSNFKKNLENIILELPFDIGFNKIHQSARFLQQFEICRFSGFSTRFSEMCQKVLPLISGSVVTFFFEGE